jgi:uncharacterized protein YraI
MNKFPIPLNRILACLVAVLTVTQLLTLAELQRYKSLTTTEINTSDERIAVNTGDSACTATVNVRALNQRSGPGENYRVIGDASRGEVFSVVEQNASEQWLRVDTDSSALWMAARYMTLSGACSNLSVGNINSASVPQEAAQPRDRPSRNEAEATPLPTATSAASNGTTGTEVAAVSALSPIFTAEVQYWADEITSWAAQYQLDPNVIATVIQIESCGDPSANSVAGAQGLFQVMPFHFSANEDMLDIETNAKRGLDYLVGALALSNGDVGLAMAGYNGGYGVISSGRWANETQRYYYWGSGIYAEASSGAASSATLDEWLAAGGSSLCADAGRNQQFTG